MRTRLTIIVAAAIVAVGLGVGLGVGLSGSGNGQSTTSDRQAQLASIQSACQDWMDSVSTEPGTRQWCTDMTQWMSTYMDRYGFGPQTMWGEPGRLSAICEHWLRTSPPSGSPTDAASWCDAMVSWMTTHMGSWSGRGTWGDWMRNGPMASVGNSPSDHGPGRMMGGS